MLETLYKEALDRKKNPKEGSYTNYLFDKGLDKILKNVGEEATEVVIGAKNADKEEIANETADVLYHLAVMLVETGVSPEDVEAGRFRLLGFFVLRLGVLGECRGRNQRQDQRGCQRIDFHGFIGTRAHEISDSVRQGQVARHVTKPKHQID